MERRIVMEDGGGPTHDGVGLDIFKKTGLHVML